MKKLMWTALFLGTILLTQSPSSTKDEVRVSGSLKGPELTLSVDATPHKDNIWLCNYVVDHKDDYREMSHCGWFEGESVTHIEDIWPNLHPGKYSYRSLLQRIGPDGIHAGDEFETTPQNITVPE